MRRNASLRTFLTRVFWSNCKKFMKPGDTEMLQQIEEYGLNVVWFEGAGHGINHEKADEVNRLMTDYFSF